MHSEGKPAEQEEEPKIGEERDQFNGDKKQGEEQMGSQDENKEPGQETHPVVAAHGPAHKVSVAHDHEAGRHTVTSHHKDGHMHTNMHDEAGKAHDEARELADVPAAGKEKNEEKDGFGHSNKGQQGAPSEEDGFAMPNLV
jgi:hypothetical protein